MVADEYTFIRCYDKQSFDSATTGYEYDDDFEKTATNTWGVIGLMVKL
ncbi:MAG: hypothetical protein Rsou_1335 [Candidatus Ruthia sp. Asou_11_S2]|nr:hypothetical protein [Candidatus Ruthia sp. Asou_11_S2]